MIGKLVRRVLQIGEKRFKVSEINGQCKFCSEFLYFFFSKKLLILFVMTPSIFPNDV